MVGRLRANKLSYRQGLDADPGASKGSDGVDFSDQDLNAQSRKRLDSIFPIAIELGRMRIQPRLKGRFHKPALSKFLTCSFAL